MRYRWIAAVLALLSLVLAACSAKTPSAADGGAPPARTGKTVLFTDPAVRQTARFQTFGPDGIDSIPDGNQSSWLLFSLPEGAQRIEIKAPFKGFRSCGVSASFEVTYTDKDGLLMQDVGPKNLAIVGFSRTEYKKYVSGGNLQADETAVAFAATAFAEPCVKKWLEPGETIAVVKGPGFESYFVPLGDSSPWQKRFVLALYVQSEDRIVRSIMPATVDWDPLAHMDEAFQRLEQAQPGVKN